MLKMIKVLADENMPYVTELFGDLCEVAFKGGREITSNDLIGIDVLLVRSITQVNDALLSEANQLKFVGSATIGTDHLDKEALDKRNITWASAPGCNAIAVAQYVLSVMLNLSEGQGFELLNKTVAIVGAGNIGKQLAKVCNALSIEHFFYDPFVESDLIEGDFRSFDNVLSADIISLHVPITRTENFPTYHMFGAAQLSQLKTDAILINSCRGDVVDNEALTQHLNTNPSFTAVMDVWQHEPTINQDLLDVTDIASSHIAGYSLEGKARGTFMLYQKWCEIAGQQSNKSLDDLLPRPTVNSITLQNSLEFKDIKQLVNLIYDVRDDDYLIRRFGKSGKGFDNLRKQYKVRRELSAITVNVIDDDDADLLNALGFNSFKV